MSYNGKLTSISVKNGKAAIKYTDNVKVVGINDYVSKEKTEKVDYAISDSFSSILRSFLGHGLVRLGLLCSKLDEKVMQARKCVDMPEFKNFNVAGLKISGDGENEAIAISLTWETPEGENVAINVPPIKINNGGYVFENIILDDIKNVIGEANMYLADKNYIGQQISMFAEEEGEQF